MSEENLDKHGGQEATPIITTVEKEIENYDRKSKDFEKILEDYISNLMADNSVN